MNRPDVVITGMGIVSSLGTGLDVHWQHLLKKVTGIQRAPHAWLETPLQYAGRVEGDALPPDTPDSILKQQRFMSPSSRFGLGAVSEAVKQSGLDLLAMPPERKALYLGTGDYSKVGYDDY